MKVGIGGLQSMATYEDVLAKQLRELQQRKPDGNENLHDQDRGTAAELDGEILNKAVARLNDNCQAHNLPLDFALKEADGETTIQVHNTDSGQEREIQLADLPRLLQGMAENKGLILDEYF